MLRGCFVSAHTVCRGWARWTGSQRNVLSPLCTASASSGSSSSFRASVSPNLPAGFAMFAAYGDFATGVLAMLALLTVRIPQLFWPFVVAFNLVGMVELIVDYYHAIQIGLPARAGELGATYAIPIIYVPLLMITHVAAFYFLLRPGRTRAEPPQATPCPPLPPWCPAAHSRSHYRAPWGRDLSPLPRAPFRCRRPSGRVRHGAGWRWRRSRSPPRTRCQ